MTQIREKLSIIIPTMQKNKDVLNLLLSELIENDSVDEIILIDNQSDDEELFKYYEIIKARKNISIYEYNKPFNYSKIEYVKDL